MCVSYDRRICEECSVSQTMLVRFAKKLGMSGYGELKARLKIDLEENPVSSEGLMEKVTQSYYKMMDDLVKRDMTGIFENLEQAERVFYLRKRLFSDKGGK